VSPRWGRLLEAAGGADWATWLHLGVARHYAGDIDGAAVAWRQSLEAAPNAWAWRNLAVVERDPTNVADLLQRAVVLAPDQPALMVEMLEAFLADGRADEALAAVDAALPLVGEDPLVRFLEASAAVAVGDLDRCSQILENVTMPWVREGSRSLDQLWYRLQAGRAAAVRGVPVDDGLLDEVRAEAKLPYAYDFRMSADLGAADQP
jgi:predicted Zn-dependent protease